jgi:hypothetical protein
MFRGETCACKRATPRLMSTAEHRKSESLTAAEISAVWAYTPGKENDRNYILSASREQNFRRFTLSEALSI